MTCKVEGCDRKYKGRGYCVLHHARLWRNGDLETHYAKTHSMSKSSEHNTWVSMKQRCLNPKNTAYNNYGGRGITVCESWLTFENFYKDMGKKPSPKHSIDRIDNDGNYEPGNCRWATQAVQLSNMRPKSNTGEKYITYHPNNKFYYVFRGANENRKHIGIRRTLKEAIELRDREVKSILRGTE